MAAYREIKIQKRQGAVDGMEIVNQTITQWLRTCANGCYTLSFKRSVTRRSLPQNKLMWLWFTAIAAEWSSAYGRTFTAQDVHDAYCMLFIPKDTPKGRVAGSTSTLTTEQMTEFLNKVQADAQTEYGITLPNPEDQYFEAWAEQYNNQ